MPKHRTPLPPELKELIQLIRLGRLFEVQKWIQEGKPIRLPEVGHFIVSPILAAVRTGFHSMVEVMLDQLAKEEDLDRLLYEAVQMVRLDLIELVHRYGANPKSISYETVSYTHNPIILRWFEDKGIDLETDHPLATAFQYKHRGALGTYMRWRLKMPQLKNQVDMALRFHARHGDMKWVSLMLWTGANPRAAVPSLDSNYSEEEKRTALQDAVCYGHLEVVRKFKIDPKKDDLNLLLTESWLCHNREIVEMLLDLGADANAGEENSAVHRYVRSLGWALDRDLWSHRDHHALTEILCLFAAKGFQWHPRDKDCYRSLRKGFSKAGASDTIEVLTKLVRAGFFTQTVFKELVSTPRMKELLAPGGYGVTLLREFAGFAEPRKRRKGQVQEDSPSVRTSTKSSTSNYWPGKKWYMRKSGG